MSGAMIFTAEGAPAANGHYSHGTIHGDLVFTATQLPINPGNPGAPQGSLEEQVRQVLANIAAILEAGGSSLSNVLRITVYVTDMASWPEVNRVYAEEMGEHKPPRGVVAVSGLHLGYLVAMDAIGALPSRGRS